MLIHWNYYQQSCMNRQIIGISDKWAMIQSYHILVFDQTWWHTETVLNSSVKTGPNFKMTHNGEDNKYIYGYIYETCNISISSPFSRWLTGSCTPRLLWCFLKDIKRYLVRQFQNFTLFKNNYWLNLWRDTVPYTFGKNISILPHSLIKWQSFHIVQQILIPLLHISIWHSYTQCEGWINIRFMYISIASLFKYFILYKNDSIIKC